MYGQCVAVASFRDSRCLCSTMVFRSISYSFRALILRLRISGQADSLQCSIIFNGKILILSNHW